MGAVYSTVLYSGTPFGIDTAGPWPGFVAVVRDVVVGANTAPFIGVVQDGSSVTLVSLGELTLSPLGLDTLHWSGRQVIADGDYLVIDTEGTSATVRVSGYLLAV